SGLEQSGIRLADSARAMACPTCGDSANGLPGRAFLIAAAGRPSVWPDVVSTTYGPPRSTVRSCRASSVNRADAVPGNGAARRAGRTEPDPSGPFEPGSSL